jgi:hypothetical protein|tara:strand:+ start:366 stop:620 length:255 start_codon:yes stop_codon:yes gene_type:complete
MSYIRFTSSSFTEDQQNAIAAVVDLFCETVMLEDDDNDCTYYETELGQSLEFALAEDLDERVVEAICDSLGTHIEDFTVETTGQ